MALQKYVIRKISALSIIASAAERYGALRFFDATGLSKEYFIEKQSRTAARYFIFFA